MSCIEPNQPILNLTQHTPTPEQLAAGVIEPSLEEKEQIRKLLTFEKPPSISEMEDRAFRLAHIVKEKGLTFALIAGAPYFMPILVAVLKNNNIIPLFSFTRREAKEEHLPDGTVKTTYRFKHVCFITV